MIKRMCVYVMVLLTMTMVITGNISADSDIILREKVNTILKSYIEYKERGLLQKNQSLDFNISAEVVEDNLERAKAIVQMCKSTDLIVTDVKITYQMKNIQRETEKIKVSVYEWTDIYYICKGFEKTEQMGFGTDHELLLTTDGTHIVLEADFYDESCTTGICTARVDCTKEKPTILMPATEHIRNVAVLSPVNHFYQGYNTANAIDYAHQWCGRSSTGYSSGMNSPGYNPAYYYCSQDCANFVSQCIHAGGVSETFAYVSWHHISPPNTTVPLQADYDLNAGTLQWISVADFQTYWMAQGITRRQGTSYIMLGNPVFWLYEPYCHVMICTGFNSAGTPLLDGHNGDMRSYPITSISGSHTYYTLTFHCDHSWSYDSSVHMYQCTKCLSYSQIGPY